MDSSPRSRSRKRTMASLLQRLATLVGEEPDGPSSSSDWMRRSGSPLPTKTLRALERDGTIRTARLGKHVLIHRTDHDTFIATHSATIASTDAVDDEEDQHAAGWGLERASGGRR
ncbi:MAG: hypothetical protein ACHREM_15975 [Polyangiales bacterium]